MKSLIFIILMLFCSTAFCEFDANSQAEEEISHKAQYRLYPGGVDEDDLKVQKSTKSIKPFVTIEALLWKARRSAMGTAPESSQNN